MKIIAPVKVDGIYASVMFRNGVGETDNPALIEWFSQKGYKVEQGGEPLDILVEEPKVVEEVDEEVDFEAMTPNELRDWMMEHGLGREIKNIRNKEKLIGIIKNARG